MKSTRKIIMAAGAAVLAAGLVFAGYKLICGREIKTVKTAEVMDELEDYEFTSYENLEFDCDVPKINADKVYQIKIERPTAIGDVEAMKDKLSKMVNAFSNENISVSDIDVNDNSSVKYEHSVKADDGKTNEIYAELFASGTFLLNDSKLLHEIRYEKEVAACVPFIDLSNNAEKSITVNGKSINLSEFVNKAESEIEKCCAPILNEGEQIKPYDAVIMKSSIDGSEYITLRFSHIIDGIECCEDGFAPTPDEGVVTLPSYITVEMTADGDIASIQNYYYFSIKEKNELEKIAPLSAATETLSEQLAPNYKYKVRNAALKYVELSECAQTESELRPMWCYTLDEYGGGFGDPSNFFQTQNAYVDAQNGNVYLVDSKTRMFELHEYK